MRQFFFLYLLLVLALLAPPGFAEDRDAPETDESRQALLLLHMRERQWEEAVGLAEGWFPTSTRYELRRL